MPASESKVSTFQYDPYRNFKFRVKWGDGEGKMKVVMGVSTVSGLTRQTEAVPHRSGGDTGVSGVSPGRVSYSPIQLQRGVTHDTEFERWANKAWNYNKATTTPDDQPISLKDFRRDIIIELYNLQGHKVMAYKVYRCWVSEYTALTELDANSNAIAIQSITLQNEGWERDTSVPEPTEPSFNLPTTDT